MTDNQIYVKTPYSKQWVDPIYYAIKRLAKAEAEYQTTRANIAEVRRWKDILRRAEKGENIQRDVIRKLYKNPYERKFQQECIQKEADKAFWKDYKEPTSNTAV
jgi:hypothetical protein